MSPLPIALALAALFAVPLLCTLFLARRTGLRPALRQLRLAWLASLLFLPFAAYGVAGIVLRFQTTDLVAATLSLAALVVALMILRKATADLRRPLQEAVRRRRGKH